jgi:hypothetical protein
MTIAIATDKSWLEHLEGGIYTLEIAQRHGMDNNVIRRGAELVYNVSVHASASSIRLEKRAMTKSCIG